MTWMSGHRAGDLPTGEGWLTRGVNVGPLVTSPVQATVVRLPSLRSMLPWDEFEVEVTLSGLDPLVVAANWTLQVYPGTPIPGSAPWLVDGGTLPYLTYSGTQEDNVLVHAADLHEGYSTLFLRTENYGEDDVFRSLSYASWSVFRAFTSAPALLLEEPSVTVPFLEMLAPDELLAETAAPAFTLEESQLADMAEPTISFPTRRT